MPFSNVRLQGRIRPLRNGVLVKNMEFGIKKTKNGILLPDDDATERGIHPRWAEVIAVGDEQKDVEVGQWILVAHGRWSRGVELNGEEVRTVDPKDILGVSDEPVQDEHYFFSKETEKS